MATMSKSSVGAPSTSELTWENIGWPEVTSVVVVVRERLRQVRQRVDDLAVLVHFEMQVVARRVTGAAAVADDLAFGDLLARRHAQLRQVGVEGRKAVAVVDRYV